MAGDDEEAVVADRTYTRSSKLPMPRQLGLNENMRTLRHWRGTVRNYYRLDEINSHFLNENLVWNSGAEHYSLAAETVGLKRAPAVLKQDLVAFLETISGYLPHAYITETLVSGTRGILDVWGAIEDLYGAEISASSFLQINDFRRETEETYKQLYERMLDHCRQHLVADTVKIEGRATVSDKLTVLSLNLVAIMWINKVHPRLLGIVKVEYAVRLKGKEQIAALVPEIARCADELLARYDQGAGAGARHVTVDDELVGIPMNVNKVGVQPRSGQRNTDGFRKSNFNSGFKKDGGKSERKCPHCVFLSGALKAKINANHNPDDCYRKDVSIRMVEAWGAVDEEESSGNDIPINPPLDYLDIYRAYLQSKPESEDKESRRKFEDLEVHDVNVNVPVVPVTPGYHINCRTVALSDPLTDAAVRKVVKRWGTRAATRKRKSPAFNAAIGKTLLRAVVDEGSEVNVLDEEVVLKANIQVNPYTDARATAAGANPLLVIGQCRDPLVLEVVVEDEKVNVDLGHAVVVRNLGTQCLVGEPGKADNKIRTIPEHKEIQFITEGKTLTMKYSPEKNVDYEVGRVTETRTLRPGESTVISLDNFDNGSVVAANLRVEDGSWFSPGILTVNNNGVSLTNSSTESVTLKKGSRLCEVRNVIEVCEDVIRRVYDKFPDKLQYTTQVERDTDNHLDDIQVDPDGIMTPEEQKMFRDLCASYKDIITPMPGRYNNYSGHVDNSINFSEKPAPNHKVYQPKYSDKMKKLLATKMDKLASWGVLSFPDQVGVTCEYLSPSMLVPKAEKGEFRLVTDFASLNRYIKKPPTASPTIQDAKEAIAKKRFFAHLDLSNYYYQSGMGREDIQFLGVLHPYRGVMCYAVEPQGLKGASEHAYEKLSRIFGALCQEDKAFRQADSLFALGDTMEELHSNLAEIFELIRVNGLTIKPSKIIVAPKKSVLFGWEWSDGEWSPTSHTTSALERVPIPTTSTQLRSYLGSFKQFSDCIDNYGEILTKLEKMTCAKGTKLQWTKDQEDAFKESQAAIAKLQGVYLPRPGDQLITYSDYSEENNAIGGRLEIVREEDGQVKRLHGGFFSAVLTTVKKRWPCEGEAMAVKMVVEFFASFIRNSEKVTVHFTDNAPTVDAWNLSKRGAYSTSPKLSSFLSGLSTLSVEVRHKAGKDMHTSDYLSRNPMDCEHENCTVCTFIRKWDKIGENCSAIRSLTIDEVSSGETAMPFHQRKTWYNLQVADSVHGKLRHLIEVSQSPEKRKTRGDFTRLKLMHNLYIKGDLRIEKDGLITVRSKTNLTDQWAISVPHSIYPSLVLALHQKFSHPSKMQLTNLLSRYYYCPGHQAIIEEVTAACRQCLTMKTLPKVVTEFVTTSPGKFATRFSTDVLERSQQRLLVTVEDASHFTMVELIPDQRTDTIRPAILHQVLPIIPMTGATIRSDNGPSFQSLKIEAEKEGSLWHRHKITWELGATYNVNKNPICENKIRELEKEILRFKGNNGPLSRLELIEIVSNLNNRVRHHGKTAKEVFLRREGRENNIIDVKDEEVSATVEDKRRQNHVAMKDHHLRRGRKEKDVEHFEVGELVLVRDAIDKHNPREIHVVVGYDANGNVEIKKLENTQFRQKNFVVKSPQLISYYSYRPGPEQPAGKNGIDLEKNENLAKEYEGDRKRQKLEIKDENEEEAEGNSMLNENIVDITGSTDSSGSGSQPSLEMCEVSEQTDPAKPAGKGAPAPSVTDQYNRKSLRSKRPAAIKANERIKELNVLAKVYLNYLHGWNEAENKELDLMDDNTVWAYTDRPRPNDYDDEFLEENVNGREMNEVIAEYQAFLGNHDQSDHSVSDQSESSLEYQDASMLPQVGDTRLGINTSILENSSTEAWDTDLSTAPPTGLTQPLAELEFKLGVASSSTQISRSGRQTKKIDYSKMDKDGLDRSGEDCC